MGNKLEYRLDSWEEELLESVEKGEWVRVSNLDEEISAIKTAALNSRINDNDEAKIVVLPKSDILQLTKISKKASKPIELVMSEIVHNYLQNA